MNIFAILSIILTTLISYSCCKGPEPVAGARVTYKNLTLETDLIIIRSNDNNFTSIIDTIIMGKLKAKNNYSALLPVEDTTISFIFFPYNTTFSDTITDIKYNKNTKRCKSKIENFEYKLNGVTKTETQIYIE